MMGNLGILKANMKLFLAVESIHYFRGGVLAAQ